MHCCPVCVGPPTTQWSVCTCIYPLLCDCPAHFQQAGTEDVKAALAKLSELRSQMETNKEMTPILSGEDLEAWNTVFEHYRQTRRMQGKAPQWFTVSWLFAECYMYRRIYEILQGR